MRKPKIKDLNKELKLECLVEGYEGTYFEIGQVWETREGHRLKIKGFDFKAEIFKLTMIGAEDLIGEMHYPLGGFCYEPNWDLVKLISTESTPSKPQPKTLSMSKKLKTYRLHFVKTECYYADVEAESLDDAIDMAEDIESGQMEAIDDTLEFEFDEDFTNRMNTDTNKGIKQ